MQDQIDERLPTYAARAKLSQVSGQPRFRGEFDQAIVYSLISEAPEPSPFRIERYDVQDGRTEVVKVLPKKHLPELGLTVSFEAGAIVYAHLNSKLEIMLVEGFE